MDPASRFEIRTPEGIVFSFALAGPVSRLAAWGIDVGCIVVLGIVARTVLGALGAITGSLGAAMGILAGFAISVGYAIALEWLLRGQTLGKRVMRLRVMDAQGLRLRFTQVVVRNLLRAVDGLPGPYLVGGLVALATRHSQRLGDLAAGTIVVRHPKIVEPDLAQALAGKYNSFRDYPHLAARLRQRVSPQEADIALRTLVRRNSLGPADRVVLFREVADHFRRCVDFPQEATDGLSDEQYVRNVVDVVYSGSQERSPRRK